MKIWIGTELEGSSKGIMTMFVSGSTLNISKLKEIYTQYKDKIGRVYFGAGRIDTATSCLYRLVNSKLLTAINQSKIKLALECQLPSLNSYKFHKILDPFDEVIVRTMADSKLFENISHIKYDTGENVYISEIEAMEHTSLEKLHGDVFESDIIIYEEAEE